MTATRVQEVSSWVPSVSSRISCKVSLMFLRSRRGKKATRPALTVVRSRALSIDLERINRAKFKDLCQLIQCRPAFEQQLRVRPVVFGHEIGKSTRLNSSH